MRLLPWSRPATTDDPVEDGDDDFTVTVRPIYDDEFDDYLDELERETQGLRSGE